MLVLLSGLSRGRVGKVLLKVIISNIELAFTVNEKARFCGSAPTKQAKIVSMFGRSRLVVVSDVRIASNMDHGPLPVPVA